MASYQAPRDDFAFVLFDLLDAETLWQSHEALAHVDRETAEMIIEEAGRLAESVLLPLNQSGDADGCVLENGKVRTPAGFPEAYGTFVEGGWGGLGGDPAHGGQGMPKMLTVAFEEMMFAANSSLYLYPALTAGATLLLAAHADEETKARWLPPLYAGRFSGTMCLTEPHAGSDLGMLRTKAEPLGDGSYAITGTKIFITGGDQDLTDNVVHLVLARLPDAPAGTRGISLFLVPKCLPQGDAIPVEPGPRNGVSVGSIEHKMGIRGSATCVMNFDGARGWLVGEENHGLACMFTMMNYERLSMGLQGLGTADIAYQNALAYARERIQGRSPQGAEAPTHDADPLMVHPDVRRMLLEQKAWNEGGRAFAAWVGMQLDLSRCAEGDAARRAADLVAFLTPVAKAFLSDRGFECSVLAQQVLGGHGYVVEWGMEQYVRDVRIAQIYEGTNGIQAMDLADRKTVRDGGRLAGVFAAELRARLNDCPAWSRDALVRALERFETATGRIVEGGREDPALAGSAAADYLDLTGRVAYGWLWARMAAVAEANLEAGRRDPGRMRAKIATARFFIAKLLPECGALLERIEAGSEPVMALDAASF
ncbi:MAG: acyl-CoA dehydrogenase C-terminal domain-containing protein [Pseudomonadales bacterium]|jgi:alkylation response protein AidB-like acyl-CoA dehydrogenase|nr:acyl-CoA dehydrogenase C-terminal domain-containing protein [Pseudomonadales bacterium]